MRTLQEILGNRGKPLYQLRLSEVEFANLKQWLSDFLAERALGALAARQESAALFVLFAAEWWKRFFKGVRWAWAPIIESLGANPDLWDANERSMCIEKGLQYWDLPPRNSRGLRYLGAIAVQGGLPIRLLAEHHGNIGQLLKRLLDLADGSSANEQDIAGWAESLKNLLPQSYQQESIYILLAQVVRISLDFKAEVNLQPGGDAVARLDAQVPDWRKQFPIALDDETSRRLIEKLIVDAATYRPPRSITVFKAVRTLLESDHEWILQSRIECGESIAAASLKQFFSIDDELSRQLEVRFAVDDKVFSAQLRKISGHEKYRFDRKLSAMTNGFQACMEHVVALRDPALGREWRATARGGQEMSPDLPWLFVCADNEWRFLRQGSGKIPETKALVAVPTNWIEILLDDTGMLVNLERRLISVAGEANFTNPSGQQYRIRTNQAEATTKEYFEWVGRRVWEADKLVFKGRPELRLIKEDGSVRTVNVEWLCDGSDEWRRNISPTGPVEFRYIVNGEVWFRGRMVLLPMVANMIYIPGDNPDHATIRFDNWCIVGARILTVGVSGHAEIDGTSLLLSLESTASYPPEIIEIDLVWPNSTARTKVPVPFPARGGRLFDADGEDIPSGSILSISDLYGARLWTFGDQAPLLTFDSAGGRVHRRPATRENRAEIKLTDYESDIHRLLARCSNLDAHVRAELDVCGVTNRFFIHIKRYVGALQPENRIVRLDDGSYKKFSIDELVELSIYALRLDCPGDEAERLEIVYSEGVPMGWDFSPSSRTPAPWLIFPGRNAKINLRALLWSYEYDEGAGGDLARAIRIGDREHRDNKLDEVIADVAEDFMQPEWENIERLARQVGHLPLVVLDLWKRFARSPAGMAALAFRMANLPDGFVERFAEELPFVWEQVSAANWRKAMQFLRQQSLAWYGEAMAESMFTNHLNQKIEMMSAAYPSLDHLLGGMQEVVLDQRQPHNVLQDEFFRNGIFAGDDAPLQRLLRGHDENEQWPEYFQDAVDSARRRFPELFDECTGFHDSVINLPILLAIQAVSNRSLVPLDDNHIHAAREHQAFDSDWFDRAFDYSVMRCLVRGMLED